MEYRTKETECESFLIAKIENVWLFINRDDYLTSKLQSLIIELIFMFRKFEGNVDLTTIRPCISHTQINDT